MVWTCGWVGGVEFGYMGFAKISTPLGGVLGGKTLGDVYLECVPIGCGGGK